MLNHTATGPYKDGLYRVGYITPGCAVVTVICECRTKDQAIAAAANMDAEQVRRQSEIDRERELLARRRIRIGEEGI